MATDAALIERKPARGRGPELLLYAGAALLMLILFGSSLLVIFNLREVTLAEKEEDLSVLSHTLAEQADRTFQSIDLTLLTEAERLAAAGIGTAQKFSARLRGAEVHLQLKEAIAGLPQFEALFLIAGDGTLVNSSRAWPDMSVATDADRAYFRAVHDDAEHGRYFSRPRRNPRDGAWELFIARRMKGPHGELIGIVAGAISLAYYEDYYRSVTHDDGGAVSLIRSDGMLLARFPARQNVGDIFADYQRLGEQGTGNAAIERSISPVDNEMRVKAVRRMGHHPAMILASQTLESTLDDWREISLFIAITSAGCALLIAVAAGLLGRQWRQREGLAQARAEAAEADRARLLAEGELERQRERTAAFEQLQRAKEAAEAADRAKSEFLAQMSHELRTPLNAIIGFSEIMGGETLGPIGNDKYRDYAGHILSSGRHLLDIINDILDLAKAAAGKLDMVREPIDLGALVGEIERLLHQRAAEAGLAFTVSLPADPPVLLADARKLKQILINLLSNAFKFTEAGGAVELAVSAAAGWMTFSVADTGIGIAPEYLDRVVEPFVQVDSSLGRRHEGTGLGLPLVKVMTELQGGRLTLTSTPGAGTTVTVSLPCAPAGERPAVAAAEPAHA